MAQTSEKTFKLPLKSSLEQTSHAVRFMVGAIKARLIQQFYFYSEHRFVSEAELDTFPNKDKRILLGSRSLHEKLGTDQQGWKKTYKLWCPVILEGTDKNVQLNILTAVQMFLGDILNQARKAAGATPEIIAEAESRINPTFFMTCMLIVLRHLNTISDSNAFRAAYLKLKELPSDTHFVYRFMDEFVLPRTNINDIEFDIITEDEARAQHDLECAKTILQEIKNLTDNKDKAIALRKLATERKCVMYVELSNQSKRDSPLRDLTQNGFTLTNVWETEMDLRPKIGSIFKQLQVNHNVLSNINLNLGSKNVRDIPRVVISEDDLTAQQSDTQSQPTSSTKSTGKPASSTKSTGKPTSSTKKSDKEDIKMPPTQPSASMEAQYAFEESEKKKWAEDVSRAMVEHLMKFIETPQGRAKVLKSLNVAAGLLNEKTKRGGDHFNLDSTRLLLGNNNNRGIITGVVDGAPLFKGRQVLLAVNIKSKSVPIPWFKESKVGTTTNPTSGNADLTAWVRDSLMPKVWKLFAAAFSGEGETFEQTGEDDADEDERVDGVNNEDMDDENTEPDDLIFKKRNFKDEMAFISAHTINLPMLPDEIDMNKLGGDLESQRERQFKINVQAMNLDPSEISRLKVVRNKVEDFYASDTQSVIAAIKRNIKVVPSVPVGNNGKPFEMLEPEEAEEAQFIADYRSGVAGKFESDEFQEEEEEEEE